MTERPVHNEPFNKRTADPFASRLLSRALIAGGLLVAALIGAALSSAARPRRRSTPAKLAFQPPGRAERRDRRAGRQAAAPISTERELRGARGDRARLRTFARPGQG